MPMPPPDETDLTCDEEVARLLRSAFPPLRGQAAALLVPAACGRSMAGVLCLVEDLPAVARPAEALQCVRVFAEVAAQAAGEHPGVLVALQRGGEAGPRESDAAWVGAAREACDGLGVQLLGVWLAVDRREPLRLDAPLPAPA